MANAAEKLRLMAKGRRRGGDEKGEARMRNTGVTNRLFEKKPTRRSRRLKVFKD